MTKPKRRFVHLAGFDVAEELQTHSIPCKGQNNCDHLTWFGWTIGGAAEGERVNVRAFLRIGASVQTCTCPDGTHTHTHGMAKHGISVKQGRFGIQP